MSKNTLPNTELVISKPDPKNIFYETLIHYKPQTPVLTSVTFLICLILVIQLYILLIRYWCLIWGLEGKKSNGSSTFEIVSLGLWNKG